MYKKYTWAGNKINPDDMAKLHALKEQTGKPITEMVAEAIKDYVIRGV